VKEHEQEYRRGEVYGTPRGVQQGYAEHQRDTCQVDRIPDVPKWAVRDQSVRRRGLLVFGSCEAHVAPDMTRQASQADAGAEPTDGVTAHGK
jgi:hypothetical protein